MRRHFALALLVVLTLPPAAYARVAAPVSDAQAKAALASKHLVTVDRGRRMNLVCIGHGSPTIVFEYGVGGRLSDWRKIAAGAAKISRACFYDPAGAGFSDPSSQPVTAMTVTADLHTLLHRAGVKGPVVLVGHAVGGLYATVYADRYWRDVAGLVLIDPPLAGDDEEDWRQEAKLAHPFGDMPITVLTAADQDYPSGAPQSQRDAMQASLMAAHNAFAARSDRGVSDVVPNARHFIQLDQPQAVLDAIADVVGRARARREP